MHLSTKDGIACDQCGTSYRHDFLYYSLDCRLVQVDANRRPPLEEIHQSTIVSSLDICPACFEKLKDTLVQQYSKIMSPQRRARVEVYCELSGLAMAGTYTFYHVNVIKVDVKTTGQPLTCAKCRTPTLDGKKPCPKCQNTKFIKPSVVTTDERFVEFNICDDIYRKFTDAASKLRQMAGQWSSQS
jgi:hypothetical protein